MEPSNTRYRTGVDTGFDFDRPSHWQHERWDEGHGNNNVKDFESRRFSV